MIENIKIPDEYESLLNSVDSMVDVRTKEELFEYDGHMYHPDFQKIIGAVIMSMVDPTLIVQWKTADKQEDGLNNVYVELDSEGIMGLGKAYFQRHFGIWAEGDALKKIEKERKLGDASNES